MPIGINNKILGGTRKWIGLNSGAGIPPVASFTTSPDPATGKCHLRFHLQIHQLIVQLLGCGL